MVTTIRALRSVRMTHFVRRLYVGPPIQEGSDAVHLTILASPNEGRTPALKQEHIKTEAD